MSAGYSGTPLVKKLGIREGMLVCAVGAPEHYADLLGESDGVNFVARLSPRVALVHVFETRRGQLAKLLPKLRKSMKSDVIIWVSWPKRASKVATDITEDVIRELALPLGFVDIKVCAVDEVWSGLKLVVRKELREA